MSGAAADDPFSEEEEHESHERYLITYADMITLLMALFIILFAIGQTDLAKYEQFRGGLTAGFQPVFLGGGGLHDHSGSTAVDAELTASPVQAPPTEHLSDDGTVDHSMGEVASGTAGRLAEALAAASGGTGSGVEVELEERGVVVALEADGLLFESGSVALRPAGMEVLRRVAAVVQPLTNDVVVEGHTDAVPRVGGSSNWELSADRAASVVRLLIGEGVDGRRLTAAGHADTRPVADNGTEAGRAANRRVELVVMVDPALDHPLAPQQPASGTAPAEPAWSPVGPLGLPPAQPIQR